MENNEKNNTKAQLTKMILDQYFLFRTDLPEAGYIKEWKTTLDIQDDLRIIDEVPLGTINAYMQLNNYTLATLADGSVAWAIWRKPLDPEG